ncbi:MAG TPA: Asp-tRNA(Asn)/Glu-tRNA(Gln) amidotransferase subunit GatA [Halanaerobiaceae bacterium]|nr:Asp-tRNA(Asn)/Glu-tRNA(Gln) amidotransferase subunit GatA [Bacillota bacterium]HHU93319.1 Asp-tRNA(Asn)/Glu-tRNA(Gln) amidotransferase subunit GatA [Halanaerobiaceae bacterium]HOA40951.1 Asp-tRNA(Asn)/Glu-tRNA(Gln) amidotransferase subunit GatA [Halanaerobiales bacterium]HPZ62770.1 Asp-tRNA(Asn)/Glu-tRNA(Gln) amidotransferase subunit GatA [Halanaerobiales bacterium]HQD04322.1 Asp-tRNA(Asn)/Glu-tRNA(Gln) amidotransferase subunit GatA [Halanaerobiales bacterium]
MDLCDLSIHELKAQLEKEEITVEEVLDSFLQRIDAVEDKVKAYVTVTGTEARERIRAELEGSLAGIPLAVKDNISTEGIRTTCSSKMLENYIPPYNATVVDKLNEAGAVLLGKTNLDEFAMGGSSESSYFHETRNPWNLEYVPGGSSGGSAAAVAAGEAAAALGTDTGGSIRQPAAFCGLVGLKPTYGTVSRYGLMAYAGSMDQIGPITRDVEDAALLLNVISGYDPKDSTSVKREELDYTAFLQEDLAGMKVALPREYLDLVSNPEIKESVLAAFKKMEAEGAKVEEVSLPHLKYAAAVYYILATGEASSNMACYDGVRYGFRSKEAANVAEMFGNTRSEGFGEEVKRRILFGTYVLSANSYEAYYVKAQKVRTLLIKEFEDIFKNYDLIITPTTGDTAFKVGTVTEPLESYKMDTFTVPVNLTGIPAISLPCGFSSKNLPIGIQIMGPQFGDGKIIQAAYSLEKILKLGNKRPELEVAQ